VTDRTDQLLERAVAALESNDARMQRIEKSYHRIARSADRGSGVRGSTVVLLVCIGVLVCLLVSSRRDDDDDG
jgi:hypothetical protein